MIQGRSSLGRLGLFINPGGSIDVGYNGTWTLEIHAAFNPSRFIRTVPNLSDLLLGTFRRSNGLLQR